MFPVYPLEKKNGPVRYVPAKNVRPVAKVSFSRISADLATKDSTSEQERGQGGSLYLKDRYGKDGRLIVPKLALYNEDGFEEDTYFRPGGLGLPRLNEAAARYASGTEAGDAPCGVCAGQKDADGANDAQAAGEGSGVRICTECGRRYIPGGAVARTGSGKTKAPELKGQYVDEKA